MDIEQIERIYRIEDQGRLNSFKEADLIVYCQKFRSSLTAKQQAILEMYYVRGMQQSEVAGMLNIRQQVVSKHIKYIIKKAKKYFIRNC